MEDLLLEERVKKIWEAVETISRKLDELLREVKAKKEAA